MICRFYLKLLGRSNLQTVSKSTLDRVEPSGYWMGFKRESPGLIQDFAKDPPSTCGAHARKIRRSECPMVGRSSFPWMLSLEKIPSFSETHQNCGDGDR